MERIINDEQVQAAVKALGEIVNGRAGDVNERIRAADVLLAHARLERTQEA